MRGTAALLSFSPKIKRQKEKKINKERKEVARKKEYKCASLTKRIVHCRLLGSCYYIVILLLLNMRLQYYANLTTEYPAASQNRQKTD